MTGEEADGAGIGGGVGGAGLWPHVLAILFPISQPFKIATSKGLGFCCFCPIQAPFPFYLNMRVSPGAGLGGGEVSGDGMELRAGDCSQRQK